MYSLTNLKEGAIIELDGVPYQVIKSQHTQLGRGGAILRTTLKNLKSGATLEKTFKGEQKFAPAALDQIKSQFLYREGDNFIFMNSKNFEQFSLPSQSVGFAQNFLKEGNSVEILSFQGQPLKINLPLKIDLKVIEAEPGVKGNSATAPTKFATLETGYRIRVPLFIKKGDMVKIDTRDGSYIERQKS